MNAMIGMAKNHIVLVASTYMVAAIFGVSLGLTGVSIPFFSDAQATPTDCTRYAPSLKPPNVNCNVNNIAGDGYHRWVTPGTALRDYNFIRTTADRDLFVEYVNSTINAYGFGTYLQIGASGAYRQAACEESFSAVYMNCTTYWH